MRQLPAGFADDLHQSSRHTSQKIAKAQFNADVLGLREVGGVCRPSTSHEQIEGEAAGEYVIFVELRRLRHELVP